MIPLFAPHIPENASDVVKELLKSGNINRGKKAEEFELQFSKLFGCKHALSVNSCTSALRLALEIAKRHYYYRQSTYHRFPEIITTPYTMVATNMAILDAGCIPVFADIDYETANLNPKSVIEKITIGTIGIMGVEYAGYPCPWEEIIDLLNRNYDINDFTLISDSAHALGATHHGRPISEYVHCQSFSFQSIKTLTTGDGGMFVTNFSDIDAEARKRAWFGINKSKRFVDELGARPLDIDVLGFKYTMNDINATLGIEGLKDFVKVFYRRETIAEQYERELANIEGLTLMKYDRKMNTHGNWMFPIHVANRSKFAKLMREKGIEIAVHNWRNDVYSIFGGQQNLPNTEKLNNDLIHIPLHAELTNDEVDYIIKTIQELNWL